MTTIRSRVRRIAGGALIVVSACAGLVLAGAAAAQASPFFLDPDQATPDRLTLETSPWIVQDAHGGRRLSLGEQLVLSPGDRGYWEIRASHDDPAGPATLSVDLTSTGPLAAHAEGLRIVFEQCLTEWTGLIDGTPLCAAPGGAVTVAPSAASASSYLVDLAAGSAQYMLVTASLDGSDASLQGLDSSVAVGLTATRTDAAAPPTADPPLATTGLDGAALLHMLGVGLAAVGVGWGVRMLRRPAAAAEGDLS